MRSGYDVLNTDAFVLHTRASGESDKVLHLLTRAYGALYVHARSIRKETAKLRSTARPYGLVYVSVINGKKFILKNCTVVDPLTSLWEDEKRYRTYVKLLNIVRGYFPVDNHHERNVFEIVEQATSAIQSVPHQHLNTVYVAANLHLLAALGYVDTNRVPTTLSDSIEKLAASKRALQDAVEVIQEVRKHL